MEKVITYKHEQEQIHATRTKPLPLSLGRRKSDRIRNLVAEGVVQDSELLATVGGLISSAH